MNPSGNDRVAGFRTTISLKSPRNAQEYVFKYIFEDIGELQSQWELEETRFWREGTYKGVSWALISNYFSDQGIWWFTSGYEDTEKLSKDFLHSYKS